jgi:predicted HTH domain antitoxin
MTVVIPDDIIRATGLSSAEVRQELAVTLFRCERLTLAQASRLAEMGPLEFQRLLAGRRIPVHYDVAEFEEDLATLHEMNRP